MSPSRSGSRRRLRILNRLSESLELRLLMSADHADDELVFDEFHDDLHDDFHADFTPIDPAILNSGSTGTTDSSGLSAGSLAEVPVLNSNPGAAATIYLDFNGHTEASWGSYSNIVTKAYDTDGDPTTFSAAELAAIEQIWRAVAEDYAPFNVNVTTVEPPSFANGVALRVVIGGNGSWTGGTYGGVAYTNSFTSSIPNTVFVFEDNLGNGNPKYTADAASHEAGHAFGLKHQSAYSSTGTKLQDYSTGPGDGRAPLMGNSYSATRSLWWYGTTTSASTYQDDMSVIANSTNGFGYRADDHGNTSITATSLSVVNGQVNSSGIIATTSDVDYFAFTSGTGQITLTVGVPQYNNLDARIELRSSTGTVIATASPTNSFGATITASVPAGQYFLVVTSQGSYGDVGQYTVTGTVIASTSAINPPSNLQGSVTAGGIALSWSDNATNETGYRVERSVDGVTWQVVANLGANATSYVDPNVAPGGSYTYRVQASNVDAVAYSSSATVTLAPSAPGSLTATAGSSSQINLAWSDVSGETGYRVERSTDGVNWVQIGTTAAGVTTYASTGLNASTTYHFRVKSANTGGVSAASPVASAQTSAAATAPAAPSNLTAVVQSNGTIRLNWQDNSHNETGFVVERSSNNGKSFQTVGSVGANVTTFTDSSVKARTKYVYRVRSVATLNSTPSNLASAQTPSLLRTRAAFAEAPQNSNPTSQLVNRISQAVEQHHNRVAEIRTAATEKIDLVFATLTQKFETLSDHLGDW